MYFSVNNSLRSGGNSGSTIFANLSLYGGIKESIAASGLSFAAADTEKIPLGYLVLKWMSHSIHQCY